MSELLELADEADKILADDRAEFGIDGFLKRVASALRSAASPASREEIAHKLMSFDGHRLYELTETEQERYFKRADAILSLSAPAGEGMRNEIQSSDGPAERSDVSLRSGAHRPNGRGAMPDPSGTAPSPSGEAVAWRRIANQDPPLPWLLNRLRAIAEEESKKEPLIAKPSDHICWLAAELIETATPAHPEALRALAEDIARSLECDLTHYRLDDGAMVESRVINSPNTFIKSIDVREALARAALRGQQHGASGSDVGLLPDKGTV